MKEIQKEKKKKWGMKGDGSSCSSGGSRRLEVDKDEDEGFEVVAPQSGKLGGMTVR